MLPADRIGTVGRRGRVWRLGMIGGTPALLSESAPTFG
jgi:hypothetical protein